MSKKKVKSSAHILLYQVVVEVFESLSGIGESPSVLETAQLGSGFLSYVGRRVGCHQPFVMTDAESVDQSVESHLRDESACQSVVHRTDIAHHFYSLQAGFQISAAYDGQHLVFYRLPVFLFYLQPAVFPVALL